MSDSKGSFEMDSKSLGGILRWSLAQSTGDAPPRQLSEEDRKWFEEAASNSVDVVKRMKEIAVVMGLPQAQLMAQGVTLEDLEGLLEELQMHVEAIDMANDLQAIGGLAPLLAYLRSEHPSLRARAAEVVSTVVQNNQRGQDMVMAAGGLPLLLVNFSTDDDMTSRTKALGAISSLIRHNKVGADAFRLGSGMAGLRNALQAGSPRLQRKTLQVLLYLMQESPSDCRAAVHLGFGPILTQLVRSPDGDVRQAVLQALLEIAQHGPVQAPSQTPISVGGGAATLADATSRERAEPDSQALGQEWPRHDSEGGAAAGSVPAPPMGESPFGGQLQDVLAERAAEIRSLKGPEADAAAEERQLIESLSRACFAEAREGAGQREPHGPTGGGLEAPTGRSEGSAAAATESRGRDTVLRLGPGP